MMKSLIEGFLQAGLEFGYHRGLVVLGVGAGVEERRARHAAHDDAQDEDTGGTDDQTDRLLIPHAKADKPDHGSQVDGDAPEPGDGLFMHTPVVSGHIHRTDLRRDPDSEGRCECRYEQRCQKRRDIVIHKRLFPHYIDLKSRFFRHLLGQFVRIALLDDDPSDPGIDDHLRADNAGLSGAVKSRALYGLSKAGSLDDSVLLRVQASAKLMTLTGWNAHLLEQAPRMVAVRYPFWDPVVSCSHDPVVFYDNRADTAP